MIKILKLFKPTAFAIFIFVILIVSQYFIVGGDGGTIKSDGVTHVYKNNWSHGIVPIIIIDSVRIENNSSVMSEGKWKVRKEDEYTKTVEVKWGLLALDLIICYMLASLLSKIIRLITGVRRLTTVYLMVSLCICLVVFIASIIFSKTVWGYYLSRPKVITNTKDIAQVKDIMPIKTTGDRNITIGAEDYVLSLRDSYYCLSDRILYFLRDKNMLPDSYTMDLADLTGLHSLIKQTGILKKPQGGYNDSDLLHGIVVDALNKKGERLVFVAVSGLQVSNDHFPYYELVFKARHGEDLKFISGQHFFYDMAGIEGTEWYVVFLFISVFAVPIGIVVLTVILILRNLIGKRRKVNSPVLEEDEGSEENKQQ